MGKGTGQNYRLQGIGRVRLLEFESAGADSPPFFSLRGSFLWGKPLVGAGMAGERREGFPSHRPQQKCELWAAGLALAGDSRHVNAWASPEFPGGHSTAAP